MYWPKIDGAICKATYHQPDILISWNLLTESEILGIKVTIRAIPNQEVNDLAKKASGLDKEDSSSGLNSLTDKLKANIYSKTQNRKNHQNSDLEDLPEKSKYLLKAEATASKKLIRFYYSLLFNRSKEELISLIFLLT